MFLRRFQKRKNGKNHVYWALVETYRTAKGPRQRVVSYLGELKESEQSGWAQLSGKLHRKKTSSANNRSQPERVQRSLFDAPQRHDPQAAALSSQPVLVELNGIRLERPRDFGDVWLAWGLWRLLGFDTLLEQEMDAGREEIPWPLVAAILVIARFCEPSSELHIETTWYRKTALEDLLDIPPEKVHTDRLYAGMDELLPHKETIEKHLKERLGQLFDLDYELLLYDVTSTYFEGQCKGNAQAKRGYSRDKRPDCLQVCIALVVTTDGMPVGYEVFAGNRHDSTTVEEIVQTIEKKHGKANRIWVMDRGMVSEQNLEFVRGRDGRYIVGTPKASLRKFEAELVEKDWEEVEKGVEVKLVRSPDGEETFILARSAERREKEKAIHERFLNRMEQGLQRIRAAMESGRLRDESVAQRRLGRSQGENSRAAKAFDVKIERVVSPEPRSSTEGETESPSADCDGPKPKKRNEKKGSSPKGPQLQITWERNEAWAEWARLSEGCYLLRSNLNDTDAKTLWKHYIQLTEAEWAFRITKDELILRPIWHHKEDRVQAHILVCFLAYALWKTLAGWMNRSGLGDAPRSLLDEIAKIKSSDVVLPVHVESNIARELRLRCVTEPDGEQKLLLHRLGLTLPKRLGSHLAPKNCSEDF
jgi:transposase